MTQNSAARQALLISIPAHFQASEINGTIRFTCPHCNKRKKAWVTAHGRRWRCNRLTQCGRGGCISEITGEAPRKKYEYKPAGDHNDKRRRLEHRQLSGALRRVTPSSRAWISSRIPCDSLMDRMDEAIAKGYLGDAARLKDDWCQAKAREGYELLAPMFEVGRMRAVTAQVRWTGQGPPPSKGGQVRKAWSLAGYSTGKGATFGRADVALERARAGALFVIGEGLPDWMTGWACGFEAIVCVAGVTEARKVCQWLASELGPEERLDVVLALDADKAGRDATRACLGELRRRPAVGVRVAEIPDGEDLNDQLIKHGPARVQEIIDEAPLRQGGAAEADKLKAQRRVVEADERALVQKKIGAYAYRSQPITGRAREWGRTIARNWKERNIPRWRWLSKILDSGTLAQASVGTTDEGRMVSMDHRIFVSDSPWYQQSASTIWNHAAFPWLQENLDEQLIVARIPVSGRADADATRKEFLRVFPRESIADLLIWTDPARGELVLVLDLIDGRRCAGWLCRRLKDGRAQDEVLEVQSRDKALVEACMAGWFGGADYLADRLADRDLSPDDEWVIKRLDRYYGRGRFALPSARVLREKTREVQAELVESHRVLSGTPKVEARFHVSYHRRSKAALLVTRQPASYDAAWRASQGFKPNFAPMSDGNLLDDSELEDICADACEAAGALWRDRAERSRALEPPAQPWDPPGLWRPPPDLDFSW